MGGPLPGDCSFFLPLSALERGGREKSEFVCTRVMKEPEQKKVADEQETLVPCHPRMMDLQQYGTHTACSVLQAQPAGWAWEVVFALLINLPLLGSQIITHTHTTQDKTRAELTKLWRRVSLIGLLVLPKRDRKNKYRCDWIARCLDYADVS